MLPDERVAQPPFYFRRLWTGGGANPDDEIDIHRVLPDGTLEITMGVRRGDLPPEMLDQDMVSLALPGGLVIYGRRVTAIPPDRVVVAEWEANGRVYAECFSEVCTDGEVGTHPRNEVQEISRAEFEEAMANGWR